jgi:hypothetical protein
MLQNTIQYCDFFCFYCAVGASYFVGAYSTKKNHATMVFLHNCSEKTEITSLQLVPALSKGVTQPWENKAKHGDDTWRSGTHIELRR